MKRLCKNIDITDIEFIKNAVTLCLSKSKKRKRNDTVKYFMAINDVDKDTVLKNLDDKEWLNNTIDKISKEIQEEIISDTINFPPIYYRDKIDGSSGKVRKIGIQNIKHQIYDYVAKEALNPLFKRIGEYQFASIKGRGTTKGAKVIYRWLQDKRCKYFVKLDIKKCFENVSHYDLMQFIERRVKNDNLIRLLRILLGSFEKGLSIGSYLSQWLCNLYMSYIYHSMMENVYTYRRTRTGRIRINLVKHCLIYMDDILLIGSSYKHILAAARKVIIKAGILGLEVKPHYNIMETKSGIDTMGYKVYPTHTEIRPKIFIRIRRSFKKARKRLSIVMAKKCISYHGYLKNTNSKKIIRRWKVYEVLDKSKDLIRRVENESNIFRETASS